MIPLNLAGFMKGQRHWFHGWLGCSSHCSKRLMVSPQTSKTVQIISHTIADHMAPRRCPQVYRRWVEDEVRTLTRPLKCPAWNENAAVFLAEIGLEKSFAPIVWVLPFLDVYFFLCHIYGEAA